MPFLQGIATLAENNEEQALVLLDRLLERHDQLFEWVDDSNGYIGDLMHEAVQLWLQVASRVREKKPEARNWVDVSINRLAQIVFAAQILFFSNLTQPTDFYEQNLLTHWLILGAREQAGIP